jgi:hypothetical protein
LALRNRWKSAFWKCLENGKQRLSYDEKVVGCWNSRKNTTTQMWEPWGAGFSLRTPSHQVTPLSWLFDLQRK